MSHASWVAVGLLSVLASASAPTAISSVVLERAVHFTTADGSVSVQGPGAIAVDLEGAALGVTGTDGVRVVVDGQWGEHDVILDDAFPLAISGGADQPDACHLVMLLPGGTSLEITGTYSGVRGRGIFDKIKKSKVANAAKKAGKTVKDTATAAGEKVAEVAGKAGEKFSEVSETVLNSLPTGLLQDLVRSMGELGVQELLNCMATSDRPGPGLSQYLSMYREQGPAGLLQTISDDVRDELEQGFEVMMATDIERIREGKPLPTLEQLIDESMAKIEYLMKRRVATGCLYEFFEPKLAGLRVKLLESAVESEARRQEFFDEKLAPLLFESATEPLLGVLAPDWTPGGLGVLGRSAGGVEERGLQDIKDLYNKIWGWEKLAIASGLYVQSLTEQLEKARVDMKKALANNDPEAARQAVAITEQWAEYSALKYGLGIIRYRGHVALYKTEGRLHVLTSKIFQMMGMSITVGDETVDAAFGLIPEVGAAIKTVGDAFWKTAWNLIGRRVLINTTKQGIHAAWELVVYAAERKLIHKDDSIDPGPLRECLRGFTRERVLAVAERNLPDTVETLVAYNDELRKLISKWEAN